MSDSLSSTNNALRLGNALKAKKVQGVRKSIDPSSSLQSEQVSRISTSPLTDAGATLNSKMNEYLGKWNGAMDIWGSIDDSYQRVAQLLIESSSICISAASFETDEQLKLLYESILPCHIFGFLASSIIPLECWSSLRIDRSDIAFEKLVDAINTFEFNTHSESFKSNILIDPMKCGTVAFTIGLYFGRLDLLDVWQERILAHFLGKEIQLKLDESNKLDETSSTTNASSPSLSPPPPPMIKPHPVFDSDCNEVVFLIMVAFPMLFTLNRGGAAAEIMDSLGLEYAEKGAGGRGFDQWWDSFSSSTNIFNPQLFTQESMLTALRLLIFLTNPDGVIRKKDVRKWMPSPAELTKLDNCWCMRQFGLTSCLSLSARAYLRLQQFEDAKQCAILGLLNSDKSFVRFECHRVLAFVAARESCVSISEDHLTKALGEASKSGLPMLRLLVARDWERLLPNSEFGQESAGLIDITCYEMDLKRADVLCILMSEEERASVKEKSRRPKLSRFFSSPILSNRNKPSSRSLSPKRHTVNFHADTVYNEMKSKRQAVLAEPVGLQEYCGGDGEIDVLAYMETLNGEDGEGSEEQATMTRSRGRSRSCYK